MNAQDRVKRAHIAIMQHKKFCAFAPILACGKVSFTEEIPTACTNGWDVTYNPEFVSRELADDATLRFVVLHEAVHKAYSHLTLWKGLFKEDAKLANIAADHFVNLALQDTDAGDDFIKMPTMGVQPEVKYRGWSVQQIFDDLKKQQEQDKGKPKPGKGEGQGEGSGFDQHDWEGSDNEAITEEQGKEIARAIRQGEMLRRKLAGKGSGNRDGVFGDLLNAKVDWRKVLRDFVTETCAGRDESSWRRPNRRFIADDVYMPSVVGMQMSELVIVFDTSGSCFGGSEMTRFVSEVKAMIEEVKPAKCHVVYCDSSVSGMQTFEEGQFAVQALKPTGGGGTDLPAAYPWLAEKNIRPIAMVILTDGYTPFGTAPPYPVLWAMTSDVQAPYGVTLQIGD